MYTVKERIAINADRDKVVDEDSEEAAFILPEGVEIEEDEAVELGLKKRSSSKNKQRDKAEDK